MKKAITVILLSLFLNGCGLFNVNTVKVIKLNEKPFDKSISFDLNKVTVYIDSKILVKDLKKRKDKETEKFLSLIAKSDTIDYSVCDSIYKSRFNNKYLIQLLKKGKVIIVKKSDNSTVKEIRRSWTNNECNWGYGYFLPGDTINFYLHIYKLCPF